MVPISTLFANLNQASDFATHSSEIVLKCMNECQKCQKMNVAAAAILDVNILPLFVVSAKLGC